MKTTKKTTERIPRYVDKEGLYLGILEKDYDYQIGWYLPEEGEFGLIIDNEFINNEEDNNLVVQSLLDFCKDNDIDPPEKNREFCFESKSLAVKALKAINSKFYYRQQKLPDWAEKALSEGWSPPKGWRP